MKYAIEHREDCSVAIIDRDDWFGMIRSDGQPTLLLNAPDPVAKVAVDVAVHSMAGSGVSNSDPGFDIVRIDRRDAPFVYNIDHYQVIEDVTNRYNLDEIYRMCDVTPSNDVVTFLKSKVFIIGPRRLDHHWVEEIPQHIAQAKERRA
jgi:hypothetical protein